MIRSPRSMLCPGSIITNVGSHLEVRDQRQMGPARHMIREAGPQLRVHYVGPQVYKSGSPYFLVSSVIGLFNVSLCISVKTTTPTIVNSTNSYSPFHTQLAPDFSSQTANQALLPIELPLFSSPCTTNSSDIRHYRANLFILILIIVL